MAARIARNSVRVTSTSPIVGQNTKVEVRVGDDEWIDISHSVTSV